jgi:hypothetical protein
MSDNSSSPAPANKGGWEQHLPLACAIFIVVAFVAGMVAIFGEQAARNSAPGEGLGAEASSGPSLVCRTAEVNGVLLDGTREDLLAGRFTAASASTYNMVTDALTTALVQDDESGPKVRSAGMDLLGAYTRTLAKVVLLVDEGDYYALRALRALFSAEDRYLDALVKACETGQG